MKRLLLALLFAASLHAQPAPQLIWVNIPGSSPTTVKCQGTQYLGWNVTSTSTFYCSAAGADWAPQSSSGGGPPTGAAGGVLSEFYPNPGFAPSPAFTGELTVAGTTATDAATIGTELTGASGWTNNGWTGSYNLFTAPGTTGVLTSNLVPNPNYINYQITITTTNISAGSVTPDIGGFLATFGGCAPITTNTTTVCIAVASTTDPFVVIPTASFNGKVAVSVKEIVPVATLPVCTLDSTGASSLCFSRQINTNNNFFITGGIDTDAQGGTNNTTGIDNIGLGQSVLAQNTTGSYNAAFGTYSLSVNTVGNSNLAIGINALASNISGNANIGIGSDSLGANLTGSNNVAIGQSAMATAVSGSNNIVIGADSDLQAPTDSGEIVIGYFKDGGGPNTTTISNLGAGGFVKATSAGLLSTVSSAGGGTPVCVSNTGSASSTAYSCSDGGSSSIAAGYQTVWQPGTNDTANTTGTPTLAVDGASAATIVRVVDGVSIPLGFPTVGKTFAGVQFLVTWNGTHWQVDGLGQAGPYASSNTTAGIGSLLGTGATDNTCIGGLACSAAGIMSNGDNTAVGYEALDAVTSGASNTVIGSKAGTGMVTGSNNFFGGYEACNASTGGNNVCIGYEAAIGAINHGLTSGSNNVIIGDQTDLNGSGSFSNSICIGHEAICQASNTVTLGDSAVTTGYVGAIPIQLQVATGTIAITASATALTCTTGTTTATNATTGMVVVISAAGTPDLKTVAPQGYVSSAGNITVNVCTLVTDTSPPSITYNWRVLQ